MKALSTIKTIFAKNGLEQLTTTHCNLQRAQSNLMQNHSLACWESHVLITTTKITLNLSVISNATFVTQG